MRDVAIVSFAQSPSVRVDPRSEVQTLVPVVSAAMKASGLERSQIGFTCSASADYLSGRPFAFVSNLEASGAWPPIRESHLEMDGAWAVYEAWVRLQHGDVDTAMVFASGKSSGGPLRQTLSLQLDPYYLSPLWPDSISMAALQASAYLAASGKTERDLAEVAVRSRRSAMNNPYAQVAGEFDVDKLLADAPIVAPLRKHDCAPISDGAAAMVLAVGDRARELTDNPVWIRGLDHRTDADYLGLRDLAQSASARIAGEKALAAAGGGGVDVAELWASFTPQELILRDALGLSNAVDINPSGGALAANPLMATGLIRIGEAANAIRERGAQRALAHATSGPCLQQNLVCILEGDAASTGKKG